MSSTRGFKVKAHRRRTRLAGVALALTLPLGLVGLAAPAAAARVPAGAYAEGYGLILSATGIRAFVVMAAAALRRA